MTTNNNQKSFSLLQSFRIPAGKNEQHIFSIIVATVIDVIVFLSDSIGFILQVSNGRLFIFSHTYIKQI